MPIYTCCPNCEGPLLDVLDVSDLSERHQAALVRFVDKFRAGAREHGDLAKGKQWTTDMLDELCDLSFYMMFQLLEMEDQRHDKLPI